ncbi:MAG: hypothetical protein SGI73_01195 [Chloroflexota bacterium]|nr:hypothetical protein [Chloroflexota bacterium]
MMKRIIDTNVPIVANGNESEQASLECQKACIDVMTQIFSGSIQVVLDKKWEIINEYKNKLRPDLKRGLGDQFLIWILTNYTNIKRCILVEITKTGTDTFNEFPDDPTLTNFDPRDRKWIAVAHAHFSAYEETVPIIEAIGHKWRKFVEAFKQHHVEVEFICDQPTATSPTAIRPNTEKSSKRIKNDELKS